MSNQQNYQVYSGPAKADNSGLPPNYYDLGSQSTSSQAYPTPQPQPYPQPHPQPHPHSMQQPQPVYTQPVVYHSPPAMLQLARPIGNCPSGGDHDFVEHYSLPGYLLAIFCFPWGICCCLCMKEKQCRKCLGHFG